MVGFSILINMQKQASEKLQETRCPTKCINMKYAEMDGKRPFLNAYVRGRLALQELEKSIGTIKAHIQRHLGFKGMTESKVFLKSGMEVIMEGKMKLRLPRIMPS